MADGRDMTERAANSYIHGTEPTEQRRLAQLNRMTNPQFVEFLRVVPDAWVLEIGSGLGILARDVAAAATRVHVVALERSPEQLAAARRVPMVHYLRGDGNHLPIQDQRFDLVYARCVLEHVGAPERVLGEMRRVARIGARVGACENDVTLLRFDPPCPTFEAVWAAFQEYQARLGGDSRIGRRLYRLFRRVGFSSIELSIQPDVHWHGSPGFDWWVQNIIGNVESARHGLVTSGFATAMQIDEAVHELTELAAREDASSVFAWNRAVAVRS
jgi:SAM-dependent methyltransferase